MITLNRSNSQALFFGLALLSSGPGCRSDGPDPAGELRPGDSGADGGGADASGAARSVAAMVGPAGAELRSGDGVLRVAIPPGAFAAPTMVSIDPVFPPPEGGIGTAYRIEPSGVEFAAPVTIAFAVDAQVFYEKNPELPRVGYWTEKGWQSPEFSHSLGGDAPEAVALTRHFSIWGIARGRFAKKERLSRGPHTVDPRPDNPFSPTDCYCNVPVFNKCFAENYQDLLATIIGECDWMYTWSPGFDPITCQTRHRRMINAWKGLEQCYFEDSADDASNYRCGAAWRGCCRDHGGIGPLDADSCHCDLGSCEFDRNFMFSTNTARINFEACLKRTDALENRAPRCYGATFGAWPLVDGSGGHSGNGGTAGSGGSGGSGGLGGSPGTDPDGGGDIFPPELVGAWAGTYAGVGNGTWQATVDGAGRVSGSHDGTSAGTIFGTIDVNGHADLRSQAEGSAACPWAGNFSAGVASGTWSCGAGITGSWSGSKVR